MINKRISPDFITKLSLCEIFVFGSNLEGQHLDGAAKVAYKNFGAIWGQGIGLQGKSYAIPIIHGPISAIKPYVNDNPPLHSEGLSNHFFSCLIM